MIIFPHFQQHLLFDQHPQKGIIFFSVASLKLSQAAGAGESSQLVRPDQMFILPDPQGLFIAHLTLSFLSLGLALSISD